MAGSLVLAFTVAGPVGAANPPIVIHFERDCPILSCTETASSPVAVATEVTPVKASGSVFHYTAIETLSSASGSVTLSMTGILNFAQTPNLTVLNGVVVQGSFNGVELSGARIHANATRLFGTTFGGSLWIFPSSAD